MTYGRNGLHTVIVSFISAMVMTGSLFPVIAQAGVVSGLFMALSGVLAPETGVGGGYLQNVQTMSLPRAAMNLDPNPSKGGGDITLIGNAALLSEEGPAGTLADISEGTGQGTQISLYVVREGDTLSGIAEMFSVSVNTIRWGNDISGSTVKVGQTLTILPITGVKHEVSKGDTLASIAKKYKGDLDEIVRFNGIGGADTALSVGTEIIIPDGEIAPAAASTASLASAPTRTTASSASTARSGYYMRPVVGGVRTQGIHGYNGVDIAAPIGTSILASASGQVIVAATGGWNGGYGNYIVVKHDNGTQTLYAHNSRNLVSVGQRVVQGQVIAYMGSTGRSTGSHVHFEIRGARNPF